MRGAVLYSEASRAAWRSAGSAGHPRQSRDFHWSGSQAPRTLRFGAFEKMNAPGNGANEITSANDMNYTGACPERSRRDGDALYASRMALRDGLRVEKSSGTLYWRAYTG